MHKFVFDRNLAQLYLHTSYTNTQSRLEGADNKKAPGKNWANWKTGTQQNTVEGLREEGNSTFPSSLFDLSTDITAKL